MRLIDKDDFIKIVKQKHYTTSSINLIENQNEIEAIPINYLKKWKRKHNLNRIEELLIDNIIKQWREE